MGPIESARAVGRGHWAVVTAALALASAVAGPACADEASLFAFPGAVRHPSSASSAALALADRWLGAQPFDNPAIEPTRAAGVSAALVRVSRQDLRSISHDYDETPAFVDLAGFSAAWSLGRVALFAYGDQPVLRLESSAFATPRIAPDPLTGPPPQNITLQSETREYRFGLGTSWGGERWRVGTAVEGLYYRDTLEYDVSAGSPFDSVTSRRLTGHGWAVQVGGRMQPWSRGRRSLTVGAALRVEPAMDVDGKRLYRYTTFDSSGVVPLAGTRAAGWEAGFSACYDITTEWRAYASLGGDGSRAWEGLRATAGAASAWALAVELHDPDAPWIARVGVGREQQAGVAESRAGRVGVGLGWAFGGTVVDVGALRRSLERADRPDSYDDRVLVSVRTTF